MSTILLVICTFRGMSLGKEKPLVHSASPFKYGFFRRNEAPRFSASGKRDPSVGGRKSSTLGSTTTGRIASIESEKAVRTWNKTKFGSGFTPTSSISKKSEGTLRSWMKSESGGSIATARSLPKKSERTVCSRFQRFSKPDESQRSRFQRFYKRSDSSFTVAGNRSPWSESKKTTEDLSTARLASYEATGSSSSRLWKSSKPRASSSISSHEATSGKISTARARSGSKEAAGRGRSRFKRFIENTSPRSRFQRFPQQQSGPSSGATKGLLLKTRSNERCSELSTARATSAETLTKSGSRFQEGAHLHPGLFPEGERITSSASTATAPSLSFAKHTAKVVRSRIQPFQRSGPLLFGAKGCLLKARDTGYDLSTARAVSAESVFSSRPMRRITPTDVSNSSLTTRSSYQLFFDWQAVTASSKAGLSKVSSSGSFKKVSKHASQLALLVYNILLIL